MKRKRKTAKGKRSRKARSKASARKPAVRTRKGRKAEGAKPKGGRRRSRRTQREAPAVRPRGPEAQDRGEMVHLLEDRLKHRETGPVLSGGDVDADWQRAWGSGEEAVGGSVATPDQDVVDEIGQALGVDQPADAPVRSAQELLRERDRFYWHLERRGAPHKRER